MEKIINSECVYDGYIKVFKLTIENNGKTYTREVASRGEANKDAVAAFVFNTVTNKAIFVKQFRAGTFRTDDNFALECVAGTLKYGEDPTECMKREIVEEIGYKVDTIDIIGSYYLSVGVLDEKITLFNVTVSEKTEIGGGLLDENENIEIIEISNDEVFGMNTNDMKTQFLIANHNQFYTAI